MGVESFEFKVSWLFYKTKVSGKVEQKFQKGFCYIWLHFEISTTSS